MRYYAAEIWRAGVGPRQVLETKTGLLRKSHRFGKVYNGALQGHFGA
jgi:hypothetical protein